MRHLNAGRRGARTGQTCIATWLAIVSAAWAQPDGAAPSAPLPANLNLGAGQVALLVLEDVSEVPASTTALPLFSPLGPEDARLGECRRLLDNEAARFVLTLLRPPMSRYQGATEGVLPIALREGGNHARRGFRLRRGASQSDYPDQPYVLLELHANSLSQTLLHEGGHVLHDLARSGKRPAPRWSAVLHSTFAVTDPLTALAEGYAEHLETLWGHFGSDPERRAYYHRLAPGFEIAGSFKAEFYAPVADLLTFAQEWARYQSLRDGLAAFAGNVYPGDYLRSQYDPARDRSGLKRPNAMVASEGVVASVVFWTVAGRGAELGAQPGAGLNQAGLIAAEQELLDAMAACPLFSESDFRPDLVDLIAAASASGSKLRRFAGSRFVELTRGVTARPALASTWSALYTAALSLDQAKSRELFELLEAARQEIEKSAADHPELLRAGLGPILPVRAPGVELELKALGEKFPLEFDLNAASAAELAAVPGLTTAQRERLARELDQRPFASLADAETRIGTRLADLGLEPVKYD